PESRDPDTGDERRYGHHPEHKFPNGPAPGYPRDESSDIRGPGNGPGPVKNGPVPDPRAAPLRRESQAVGSKIRDVIAQGEGEGLQDEHGGSHNQHKNKQTDGQGECPNTFGNSAPTSTSSKMTTADTANTRFFHK